MSPTFEYLATTHVNDVAIYLWSNKTLYSHVSLKQLPEGYEPKENAQMPSSSYRTDTKDTNENTEEEAEDLDYNDYKNYTSPEQIDLELITLSLLPESRWKNLINLDIIKVF
jgi:U3 small nucleolar RNA-associated protein 21